MNFRKALLILIFTAVSIGTAYSQQIVAGADFDTRFDNREYSPCAFDVSKTYFSARLVPQLGVTWEGRNTLMFGVDMLQDFGDNAKFLTDAKPVIYYKYSTPKFNALAGMFQRKEMIGFYSDALYSSSILFYDNIITGFMANYRSGRSYFEATFDWMGMQTKETREKFCLTSAGRYSGKLFYGGYTVSMLHLAKSANENTDEGVVDNLFVSPYVGVEFNAYFDFDIRLDYIQTMQRDRRQEAGWVTPKGGQFHFAMSRWGLTLSNTLYFGQNIQPFADIYGSNLYWATSFFSTTKKIYNKTAIMYNKWFFHDTVGIKAGMLFHYDGVGLGLQQLVQLSVRFNKTVYNANK